MEVVRDLPDGAVAALAFRDYLGLELRGKRPAGALPTPFRLFRNRYPSSGTHLRWSVSVKTGEGQVQPD